ncbi:hypothetical protein Csa_023643, partial [Cucumis sativus]
SQSPFRSTADHSRSSLPLPDASVDVAEHFHRTPATAVEFSSLSNTSSTMQLTVSFGRLRRNRSFG